MTGHPAPVVIWRKSSGKLPQERAQYNRSVLQILHVRKDDLDTYFCLARNLLGSVEKKTWLVVVSIPRFTVKPPVKVVAWLGDTLTLNCSATGDPLPVISWKRQGAQMPVGRSQQINGALVLRNITRNDPGYYICVATSAVVFHVETMAHVELPPQGRRTIKIAPVILMCKAYIISCPDLKRPCTFTRTNKRKTSTPGQLHANSGH